MHVHVIVEAFVLSFCHSNDMGSKRGYLWRGVLEVTKKVLPYRVVIDSRYDHLHE